MSGHTHNGSLFYIKRSFGFLLLLAMAAVFFYSGLSKLGLHVADIDHAHPFSSHWNVYMSEDSFDAFQWTFLDLGISSITLAGIIARLFIGFELLLGVFLLLHIYLRQFTYPAIIGLLGVFIIYLIVVLVQQGNTGNCGCFGKNVEVSPLMGIVKNVVMIAATLILIYIYPVKPYKNQEWIGAVAGMAAIILPFVLNPLASNSEPEGTYKAISLEPLYQASPVPAVELRKGKHIVAFMSLTCPHCRKAAYLLQIIHHQHPELPIYLVLNGSSYYDDTFFKETHAQQVPHIMYRNTEGFISMAGPSVPAIYWINNGYMERTSTYYQLDPKYMQEWMKGK